MQQSTRNHGKFSGRLFLVGELNGSNSENWVPEFLLTYGSSKTVNLSCGSFLQDELMPSDNFSNFFLFL